MSETPRNTVLIVDDHPIVRRGLREVLEETGRFEVVAEVDNGDEAIEWCLAKPPTFVLLDIAMPGRSGLSVLEALEPDSAPPHFVLLTMYDEYLDRAIELGARGYVLKDRAELEIVTCLDRVGVGKVYVSAPGGEDHSHGLDQLTELTSAERRVLSLLAEFKTSRQIGEALGVSHRTVQNQRARAAEKLGLRGTNALLRFAIDHREQL